MFREFINLLFPPVCPICEKTVCTKICRRCLTGMEFIKAPLCSLCGIPFVSDTTSCHICGQCIRKKPFFTRARSLARFQGSMINAVHLLKYGGRKELVRPLAAMMHTLMNETGYDLIVPVPLHRSRLRKRGFNQSLLLARAISKKKRLPMDCINLIRTIKTESQTHLTYKERKKNVKGAFASKRNACFAGKDVLLVDDVYTTGATVGECAKIVKKAGAKKVGVITLARTVKQ